MEKPGRDEQRLRKAMAIEFDRTFKASSKLRKWGYLKPTAFVRRGAWFVAFHPTIWVDARRSELGISVKPFALDDLVSRIMLHDGLDDTPLSLRARGPHCLVRPMFVGSIESDGRDVREMDALANRFADESLDRVAGMTLDDFIEFTRDDVPPGKASVNHVAALILVGRHREAMQLCDMAISTKQWGGPARIDERGATTGFFELAGRWIGREALA
ncbi:hypothetical protein [Sphingomonas sp. MS122]|uniref:hypothetical protein n=1 Tax=Sphingomonas sp. MS122 TaxID=3412683 RepID=UPI003C2F806A